MRQVTHIIQIVMDNRPHYAEVQFFFQLSVDPNAQPSTFALISYYGPKDEDLFVKSFGTVWSCTYEGDRSLAIAEVKFMTSVVAMVPHPVIGADKEESRAGRFYVAEKLGLDIITIDSGDIDRDDERTGHV